MGSTTVRLGGKGVTFAAVELPELRDDPVVTDDHATFVQTYGGRTALPAPRHVPRPPFVQFRAPLVWTTLALTINADGSSSYELTGASVFPRHWVYDAVGQARGQGRARRLQAVVPQVVRPQHAVGLDEQHRARDRGRDRARTRAGRADHARRRASRRSASSRPARCSPSRANPATRCSSCSTACSRSRSTASRSPSSARARSSASARCSKAACARRRCARSRSAGSPVAQGDQLDREVLEQISEGHRREHRQRVRLLFCGVRGSTPAPGAEFVRVGGHTSCVALAHDGEPWSLAARRGHRDPSRHRSARRRRVRRHAAAHPSALGSRAGTPVLRGRRS